MRLASLFGNHAILQRNISTPVWGWTTPLARVSVKLGPYAADGMAGDDGKFLVRLPPMPAGGPFVLEAEAVGDDSVKATDIWVGEVWIASGQSNMEWPLSMTGPDGDAEMELADDSGLRMFTVPRLARLGRQTDVKGTWNCCSPETAGQFSAVAYHFAKRLRQELGVPVGILNSSWGGTIAEAWTGREWLVRNPHSAAAVARYEADVHLPAFWERTAEVSRPFPADPGNLGEPAGWAKPTQTAADWQAVELPNSWQSLGHNYSGVFWFRKTVEIPAAWAGKTLALRIGAVDKQDVTYFNGTQVGATGTGFEEQYWNQLRNYQIPGNLVKPGLNTIAVRAYSFAYAGGLIGPAHSMTLALADASGQPLSLAGTWHCREEHNFGLVVPPISPAGPDNPNTPYILHDSMIAPLQPYAIRGAIWYQGESNADRASEYRSLLTDMIRCWRQEWGQGDFPFIQVQLANYMKPCEFQPGSNWALLREAQLQTLTEPETGLAVVIDIGEEVDIHPKNKRDVGGRLAQWALAKTYQREQIPAGPLYHSMVVEGAAIRVRFEHAAGGLVADSGPLHTFVVAGADRQFKKAEAMIDGATLLVSSPDVPTPVAVRYAWADNPEGCNLRNAAGLPASPFRTDHWA